MRISDPRVMRALSHPARIKIVEYLNDSGASVTATECASMVGLSPSATSYHLRELAKYGLVEQAPSQGDGRERRWQGVGSGLRIDPDMDEPGAKTASKALVELYLVRDLERTLEWFERVHSEPPEWQEIGTLQGRRLMVTAGELKSLVDQISELLEPYQFRTRRESAPEGARRVVLNLAAFPEAQAQEA
jgi:DNA-binding transcriptional ArsR family regulator